MVNQIHLSKIICISALKKKIVSEVAYQFLDVFCLFRVPSVLKSDNGHECGICKSCDNWPIYVLKYIWEGLTIVYGKPRHSQI